MRKILINIPVKKGLYFIRLALVFLFFPVITVFPQRQLSRIRQITTADGISPGDIKYILKDSQGFMWLAFSTGISRYDGYHFAGFDHFLADSTIVNAYKYVTSFLEDRDGNLWIGTLKNGLVKYDRFSGLFTSYTSVPGDTGSIFNNTVGGLFQDRNGMIWIGSYGRCLCCFDPHRNIFRRFPVDSLLPGLHELVTRCYHEDRSETLWVGTTSGLLHQPGILSRLHPFLQ